MLKPLVPIRYAFRTCARAVIGYCRAAEQRYELTPVHLIIE
jgi:hypothetical protein